VTIRGKTLTARAPAALAPWLVVAAGATALVLRTRLDVLDPAARIATLFAFVGLLLAGGLLVPVAEPRSSARLSPVVALAIGLAGLVISAAAAGTPAPLALGAWALPLSVCGAVAEEALFRRAAYGTLAAWGPGVAVVGTAALFALIHVPLYGVAAFPVDLGAGLMLGWQRWASGTWTVPAATHVAANVMAVLAR
jgi:membrane protease YdiL (CAAX protease family)